MSEWEHVHFESVLLEAEEQLLKLACTAKVKVLKRNTMDTLVSACLIEVSGKLPQRMQRKTKAFKERQPTEKYLKEKSVKRTELKYMCIQINRKRKCRHLTVILKCRSTACSTSLYF